MAKEQFYLCFDTETGSLTPETGDVLTAYFVVMDEDFKILEELDLKLKPDGRLPIAEAGALKVNGINLHEHIENPETVTYSQAKTKLVAMIKKYLKKTGRHSNIRPIGYNLPFDIGFVQKYIIPSEEWQSLINYNTIDPKVIVNFFKDCTYLPSEVGSLVSMVKHFQIGMGTAHTAKADTLATVEVYRRLLDIMKSKKDGGQAVDLISLLEAE